jgi:DNA polymerase (family 10)
MAAARSSFPSVALSNAAIADQLVSLAQLLSTQGANPFKVKAYRRAAETLRTMSESVDELVRTGADLTAYHGIGKGISSAIRELVESGTLGQLETIRSQVSPELAALSEYPRLDPRRVLRIYQQLDISSIAALKDKLESGEIARKCGVRMDQHVRQALTEAHELLLYDVEPIARAVQTFLREKCPVTRVAAAGDFRRRVEVVGELSFLIETPDFPGVIERLQRYGGHTDLVSAGERGAFFKLSSGIILKIETATGKTWGLALIRATGSDGHVRKLKATARGMGKLTKKRSALPTEKAVYQKLGLAYIEPELREGNDEVERAAAGTLPRLVQLGDIRGELHAHSTSSDGAHSIEEMAAAAKSRSYEYLGITDHSQSLKIAGGVSEEDLWTQIRVIDKVNEKLKGIRILKSAEVDILADGSLDYPNELLRELDYTVCSIHSRFAFGKAQQTERILRAMDNPYFTILGHATGRLLLKRPGYEIDIERVIDRAKINGVFFEINSSPDRLDLSSHHARLAHSAGVKIAICTDAHSVREFDFIQCGVDQARRAGLPKESILNCMSWPALRRAIKRSC